MDRLARRRTARESASERGSYTHESERGSTCEQRKREILRDGERVAWMKIVIMHSKTNNQFVYKQTNNQFVYMTLKKIK